MHIRFDKLDNLADFTYDPSDDWSFDRMMPNFKDTNLAEYVYGNKLEVLVQKQILSEGAELPPYVDFRDLSIKRNLGKWSLMLPVMAEYFHPGNGSHSNWIRMFATYSDDVPTSLVANNEPVQAIIWDHWDAKDILSFPDSEAFLFQYDYFISIGLWGDEWVYENNYDVIIPINIDEYIVSISFADATTQERWATELRNAKLDAPFSQQGAPLEN